MLLSRKAKAQALLAAQKQATQAEVVARQAAQVELVSLSQTVRVLFGADQTVLTSLGLLPRRSSANGVEAAPESNDNGNGNSAESGNGNGYHRLRPSLSLAETIARSRLLLANIQTLTEEQQTQLASAGWSAERLTAATNLVEACAAADTAQQQKIQAYRAESAAARTAEIALRQWYSHASRLSKLAIKRTDPANQERLQALLGL